MYDTKRLALILARLFVTLTDFSCDSFSPAQMICKRQKAIIKNVESSVIECVFIQIFHS